MTEGIILKWAVTSQWLRRWGGRGGPALLPLLIVLQGGGDILHHPGCDDQRDVDLKYSLIQLNQKLAPRHISQHTDAAASASAGWLHDAFSGTINFNLLGKVTHGSGKSATPWQTTKQMDSQRHSARVVNSEWHVANQQSESGGVNLPVSVHIECVLWFVGLSGGGVGLVWIQIFKWETDCKC